MLVKKESIKSSSQNKLYFNQNKSLLHVVSKQAKNYFIKKIIFITINKHIVNYTVFFYKISKN
jgi:hypothetical protein